GLRAWYRRRVARPLTLTVGVDWLGTRTHLSRAGSLSIPSREGDIFVFGEPPGGQVAIDSFTAHISDVAPHAVAELRLGPLTLTPGLRADLFILDGDRATPRDGTNPPIGYRRFAWALDPRLAIAVRAHRRVILTASAGIYHQAPDPADLSAVFGNPTLAPA